jgi:RNA polymerase sigma-70 factor, ECF subfamily
MESDSSHRRDRLLLSRLAAGQREALGELYDRHAVSLYRHAMVLAGRRADAEDLMQTVFVKVATTGAALLAVRSPAGYLHRILHTTWIDGERRKATAARSAERISEADQWRTDSAADAIDLSRALESLPVLEREAIVLHLVDGFSFREIGRLTGVSLFTAAGRYRVGIGRMRQKLGASQETRHETS